MRPDVTVVVERGSVRSAVVIEVKLTEDRDYMMQGLHEAIVYRWEYAEQLRGWPKAILVTSANVPGQPRAEDGVVAIGWSKWPSPDVVEGITGLVHH